MVGAVYKPLYYFVIYIIFGMLLSMYGPIEYYNYDIIPVFLYMSCFLVLFICGYMMGVYKRSRPRIIPVDTIKMQEVMIAIKICILMAILFETVELVSMILNKDANFSISEMGRVYVDSYSGYVRGESTHDWFYVAKIFLALPVIVTLILGAYYFRILSYRYKFFVVYTYFSIFVVNIIGSGKQKQLGDILVFLFCVFSIKAARGVKKPGRGIKIALTTLLLFGVFGLVYILKLRYMAVDISAFNINEKANELISYDLDHLVFSVFGLEWGFPVAVFVGYLSGGYYGLYLSLQMPFIWTYFIGNSYSMMMVFHKYLGLPFLLEDTYPHRVGVSTGWDEGKWHTIFPWFASDYTFAGTLFIFSFIAYLYAQTWKEAYRYGNPLSIVLFSVLTLGLVFVPANNQLLHSPEGVITIFILFVTWVLFHKRFNFLLPVRC